MVATGDFEPERGGGRAEAKSSETIKTKRCTLLIIKSKLYALFRPPPRLASPF